MTPSTSKIVLLVSLCLVSPDVFAQTAPSSKPVADRVAELQGPDAPQFENGVHLVNLDDKPQTFTVNTELTTRICWVVKPTKTIKNGISEAHARHAKGITFRRQPGTTSGLTGVLEATVQPHTSVFCLRGRSCTLQLGTQRLKAPRSSTVVIVDGTLQLLGKPVSR